MIRRHALQIALLAAALAFASGCSLTKPGTDAPVKDKMVKINKEAFDKVQLGITYEQLVQAVGGEGTITEQKGTQGEPGFTVIVLYPGVQGGEARFVFKDSKLGSKTASSLD